MFRYITLTILAASAAALVAPRSPEPSPPPIIVTEPTPAVGQPQPVAHEAPAADAVSAEASSKPATEASAATHLVSADAAPYGYCPHCGAPGKTREKRINGNDTCDNGHVYPSRSAVDEAKGTQRTKACECVNCICDPCVCGPSKGFRPGIPSEPEPERFDYEPQVPHYRSTTAGWVPCKMLTASEARELNATIMRATQPATKPATQTAPVTTYSYPAYQQGNCANGQCGVGYSRGGLFGRRW